MHYLQTNEIIVNIFVTEIMFMKYHYSVNICLLFCFKKLAVKTKKFIVFSKFMEKNKLSTRD